METPKTPTICLNMIVKNESRIITRLFDSVIPIIDCYCICDTGSTDNTVNIITEYFENKGIPGKVVLEPFKNFCHNRNYALQSCQGMSDYILLLDADMVLEIKTFDKNILNSADSFYILQGNDAFYYQNMRIVKNNGLYSYSGVTHEYINTPQNNRIMGFEKKELEFAYTKSINTEIFFIILSLYNSMPLVTIKARV
jgi:glycosyltransferase involved in cell wall biosynthesis